MPRAPRTPLTPEQIEAAVSRLDPPREMFRQFLIETGELAFGTRWQAPMAVALSRTAGRRVSAQSVHNWVVAFRPFPDVMIEPLKTVGRQLAHDARRRADRLIDLWDPPPRPERPETQEDRDADEAMRLADEITSGRWRGE